MCIFAGPFYSIVIKAYHDGGIVTEKLDIAEFKC
jgi:hypothetical protein